MTRAAKAGQKSLFPAQRTNEPTKEGPVYSLNLHLLSQQEPPLSSFSDKSQKLKQK